jgi:hypothetical protein
VKLSLKTLLYTFILFGAVALAQTTPSSLPLTLEGTGPQLSASFTTTGPWQLQSLEGSVTTYLYDATTRKIIRKLTGGEVTEQTGTFYVYVVAPEGTSWQLSITADAASASSQTMSEGTTTTENAAPETATPEAATTPETTAPTATESNPAPESALSDLPPVDKRTEKNWGKHYGYQVSRFTRTAGATPGMCSNYSSPVEAQAAFIKAGGPDQDPDNVDPDGDGYACDYNPVEPSYAAAITCAATKQWVNPHYRKNGSYAVGGCQKTKSN